jgi:glycosyltransferase involved in cell wall biosynthesis
MWWCNAFDPPAGGAELWAQHVVRHFHASGHDQRVIAVTDSHLNGQEAAFEGVPLTTMAGPDLLSGGSALASALCSLGQILNEQSPDVVLVNNFGHASLALLGLLRSRIAAPLVLIAHNRWIEEAAAAGSPLDLAVRRAAGIVTFDGDIADWLGSHWPSAAISLVDHGFPMPDGPVLPLPATPQLLFCARLNEDKGPMVLVDAMGKLGESHPEVRLVMAGTGNQRTEIEARIASLGLDERIRLLGGVPPDRVAALLDQCFLLCVPSISEGFGLIALEAAWRGRPVVASGVGGLLGTVADGETGLLVPPGDPSALADALASLISDPMRARDMGCKARQRAERRPGWAEHLQQFEDAVTSAIRSQGYRGARASLG